MFFNPVFSRRTFRVFKKLILKYILKRVENLTFLTRLNLLNNYRTKKLLRLLKTLFIIIWLVT